jgi:hypothetical protein
VKSTDFDFPQRDLSNALSAGQKWEELLSSGLLQRSAALSANTLEYKKCVVRVCFRLFTSRTTVSSVFSVSLLLSDSYSRKHS